MRNQGFTIIEILISTTLGLLILTAASMLMLKYEGFYHRRSQDMYTQREASLLMKSVKQDLRYSLHVSQPAPDSNTDYLYINGIKVRGKVLVVDQSNSRLYKVDNNISWAADDTVVAYEADEMKDLTEYTVDYPGGSILFNNAPTDEVKGDFSYNQAINYTLSGTVVTRAVGTDSDGDGVVNTQTKAETFLGITNLNISSNASALLYTIEIQAQSNSGRTILYTGKVSTR